MLSENLLAVLKPIHAATLAHPGFAFANPKHPLVRLLEKDGYVDSNPTVTNPADAKQVAYRTTAKGAAEFPSEAAPGAAPATAPATGEEGATTPVVALPVGGKGSRGPRGPNSIRPAPTVVKPSARVAELPEGAHADRRRGAKGDKYEIEQIEAPNDDGYDSRWIPVTEHMPEPWKQLGGNVSKANKKFKGKRQFKLVRIDAGKDVEFPEAGARIYRVL